METKSNLVILALTRMSVPLWCHEKPKFKARFTLMHVHGCFQVNSKVKQPLSEVNTCLIVLCPIVTEQITTLIR